MDIRTVEVNRNGTWKEISFMELNKGDNFRMFESNGDIVLDREGNTVFYSTSEPYKNEEGIWSIETLISSK